MIYWLTVGALAAAGLAYVFSALWRWRSLSHSDHGGRPWLLMLIGLGAHVTATTLTVVSLEHGDLMYAAGGSLMAALAMLTGTRFLAVNTPGLLLMPVGVIVLLVAVFAAIDRPTSIPHSGRGWVFFIHVIFMSASMAAVLLAAATAMLYLLASTQLKAASTRALRLPRLPQLGLLTERSLLVALAMHLGGLVSGAVAIGGSSHFTVAHPTVILALVVLAVLALTVILRATRGIGQRAVAYFSVLILALEIAAMVTLLVIEPHG